MFSKALRNPRAAFVVVAAALAIWVIVELVLFALSMSSHRRDQETAFRMLAPGGTCDKTGPQLIQEGLVGNCGRQIVIRDKAPATAAAEKFAARYAVSNLLNTTAENFGKIFLLVLLSGLVIALMGFQKYSEDYLSERRAAMLLPSMAVRKRQ